MRRAIVAARFRNRPQMGEHVRFFDSVAPAAKLRQNLFQDRPGVFGLRRSLECSSRLPDDLLLQWRWVRERLDQLDQEWAGLCPSIEFSRKGAADLADCLLLFSRDRRHPKICNGDGVPANCLEATTGRTTRLLPHN